MKISIATVLFWITTSAANAAPAVQCWGNNAEGQATVPADLALASLPAHPIEVRTARGATCALGSDGSVRCRGIPMADIPKLEALTGVQTFGISSGGACALVGAQVQCFSAMGDATFEQVPALTTPKSVVVAASTACALDSTGVKCWGANDSQIAAVPTLTHPSKIVAGASDICALNDTGVVCWGDGNSGIESIPTLANPTDLFMGAGFACALDANGVECWGTATGFQLANLPKATAPTQYVAGQNHICTLDSTGVKCLGDNSLSQLNIPALSHPTRLFADSVGNQTCALDDSGLVCWGEDQASQSSLGGVSSISAGYGNTCVTVRGKMECWGTGSKGINAALALTDAYQISLGSNFACTMNVGTQATNSCWGDNPALNALSPPLPPEDYTQGGQFTTPAAIITSGFNHFCENIPGQAFTCFGNNDYGQTKLPVGINPILGSAALTAGGNHTCEIDVTQGLVCWGSNQFGESTVPKTLKNIKQVTAGFSHTCALDDNGVTCWGRSTEGQTKVPPLSHPRYVQAGGYHTCALDDHGVSCWGDNSFGQSAIPKNLTNSRIANVSTGLFHTCVVTP